MIARGSDEWRRQYWGDPCVASDLVTVSILGIGRITCHRACAAAFEQLGLVFRRHGYQVRSSVTGCFCCRQITGGTTHSSHSWAIALDVNWDTNPYRTDRLVTDMSASLIAEVLRIKTIAGVQAFRWGGDWDGRPETPHSNYDAMHFEVIATPEELAMGFAPSMVIHEPRTWPILREGAVGPAVRELQLALRIPTDSAFGRTTRAAVIEFQRSRGLTTDGEVGLGTWTALLSGQPPTSVAPAPSKGAPSY